MRTRLHNDEKMMKQLILSYQPWCRRLTPGDAYLDALQEKNASLIDDPITEITESGVVTKLSTSIMILMSSCWLQASRTIAYRLGTLLEEMVSSLKTNGRRIRTRTCLSQFQICRTILPFGCGPNFTIANGPVMSAFGFMSDYILKWCIKLHLKASNQSL